MKICRDLETPANYLNDVDGHLLGEGIQVETTPTPQGRFLHSGCIIIMGIWRPDFHISEMMPIDAANVS